MPQRVRKPLPDYWPKWKDIDILVKYKMPDRAFAELILRKKYPRGRVWCDEHKKYVGLVPVGKATWLCDSTSGRSTCHTTITPTQETIFAWTQTPLYVWFSLARYLLRNPEMSIEDVRKLMQEKYGLRTSSKGTARNIRARLLSVLFKTVPDDEQLRGR